MVFNILKYIPILNWIKKSECLQARVTDDWNDEAGKLEMSVLCCRVCPHLLGIILI